jgi:twinkle protein
MSSTTATTRDPVLGEAGVRFFEERGINSETAARFGVFTARRVRSQDGGWDPVPVPDAKGNIIAFPVIDRGAVVNEYYRMLPKAFWSRHDGKRTLWNGDVLDDQALADGRAALVITEGREDALTAIDCGFPFTVSVPDGAPNVPKGKAPDELDAMVPEDDAHGKFEFLWINRARLKPIRRFILAVDDDPTGKRLAAELVRRLLPSRCLFVTYPGGCKDLNEVRMKHGPEAVASVLNGAKPYPVHGLYRLSEFPDLPAIRTYKTGWRLLDDHLRVFLGELMFVLGIPGHGKSVLIANMLMNFAEFYGWRAAIFSPEEPTVPHLRDKFRKIRNRGGLLPLDIGATAAADRFINDHFVFITADPLGQGDQEVYADWLIERATDAVLRDGIRVLVVDPFNELEQDRRAGETQTEYIGRTLRKFNHFRHLYGVMVIILIHPTKDIGKDGRARAPTPYDADGSAAWFNKADHFLIVHRDNEAADETLVRVGKVKFDGTGRKGAVRLAFDVGSCRFNSLDGEAAMIGTGA